MMSTIIYNCGLTDYDQRILIKGAAEIVLESCSFYLDENGIKLPLLDENK